MFDMAEEKFTAIVVGAGPSGSTAAYLLAKEGHDVVLVERGTAPGSKNMYGGRMYSHALNRIMPEFWKEAPVERPVAQETITFLNGGQSVSISCSNMSWATGPYHSFTLLRADFDAWLAAKAEEAGAMLACGIRVDELLIDGGRVIGIRAGEEEMLADVVIAADGVNSLLAQKAGWAKMFAPSQVATGSNRSSNCRRKPSASGFNLRAITARPGCSWATVPMVCREAAFFILIKAASLWDWS